MNTRIRFFLAFALSCVALCHGAPIFRGVIIAPAEAPPSLVESSNGDTITPGSGTLVDASLRSFTISADGIVLLDNQLAGFTSQVVLGKYYGHKFYQENSAGNWWYWDDTTPWVGPQSDPEGSPGAVPVVNSSSTASGTVGSAFSYTITATNPPLTGYSATGLPSWASRSGAVISGTPDASGSTSVTLTATNGTGTSAGFTLSILIADTPVSNGNAVFAHKMVKMGRYTANSGIDKAAYKAELQEGYAAGVTAYVVYWDNFAEYSGVPAWNSGTSYAVGDFVGHQYGSSWTDFECIQANTGQEPSATVNVYTSYWVPSSYPYKTILTASEELVAAATPAAKVAWGILGLQDTPGTDTEMLDFIVRNKDSTGLYRDGSGRFIISGYNNAWTSNYLGYLTDRGCAVAYWPDQAYAPNRASVAATVGASGLFTFFHGGVLDEPTWETLSAAQLAQCNAAGIEYMPGIFINYIGNQNARHGTPTPETDDRNFQMFYVGGPPGLAAQWAWCRANGIHYAQMVTETDFQESSYFKVFGDGAAVTGPSGHTNWTNSWIVSHEGAQVVNKHYSDWFTTGTEPTITTDHFVLVYPLHPRDAASYLDLDSTGKAVVDARLPVGATAWYGGNAVNYAEERMHKISTHGIFEDHVWLWAACSGTRKITLSLGSSTTGEQTLAQGVHILVIDGAATDSDATYGNKPRFTTAQYGSSSPWNAPHVLVKDGSDVTLIDTDGPEKITPYGGPGWFNPLWWEVTP